MEKANKTIKFEPWEDFSNRVKDGCLDIDVPEPPCKNCKNWRPRITTTSQGDYNGVVLCISKEMYHDFSCYISK